MNDLPIDTISHPSPNFSERPAGVRSIVLHTGEGTADSDLHTLTNNRVPEKKRVSAHYYVTRAGLIYQLVDPRCAAWHAGVSFYAGLSNWNDHSIGIETEHRQGQDWPTRQKDALAALCRMLIARYSIDQRYIAAHRWIAPTRKTDPSDWPDATLIPWIAGLYANRYRFRVAAPAFADWELSRLAPSEAAPGGWAAGDVVEVDAVRGNVAHAGDLGFVPKAVLERL